ncbi:hypothetical protein BGX31_002248 [Mortierella sp. GBA43]|nr:hypothetical protein BGX31_002248 [Mortierella sp. GBA43]
MSALLAKLQLRSAQPAASPSSQDPSAIAIANDDPLGLLAHHSHAQQANLTSGPVAQPTYTTAVASRAASQVKKPAPFQNLGLHSGAASGNLGLVKFALDNGQPIDSVLNGVYPIHAACCSNANIAVVMYLIERGADVNARRLPRKYSSEKGV